MQIRLPDGVVYKLDNDLSDEDKLEKVNEILNNHSDYFNDKFETGKVKTILDILYNYLYQDKAIEERKKEYSLLNQDQLKRRRKKEISVDNFEPDTLAIINNKAMQKEKGKKAIAKYKISKTHKLTTLRIPIDKRKNGIVEDESKIHTHIFNICEIPISYKNLRYKQVNIDCFTEQDQTLPYISPSVSGEWVTVYDDLTFTFDGVQRQIKGMYEFDKILCYKLDNKILFFNPEIEQVKDFSKKSIDK